MKRFLLICITPLEVNCLFVIGIIKVLNNYSNYGSDDYAENVKWPNTSVRV